MNHDFRVGDWLIEPDLNRISTAGTIVPIEPKVMELLVHLSNHPNQVLRKQDIIKAVWPDTFVSDEVLRYSISQLRKAFGDDAQHPRVVDTITRRGYRLIARVAQQARAPVPQPQPSARLATSFASRSSSSTSTMDAICGPSVTSESCGTYFSFRLESRAASSKP